MRFAQFLEEKVTGCPVATFDLGVNLKNRQHAIDKVGYGPANPDDEEANNKVFWIKKAKMWGTTVDNVKTMKCYNCAAFNISSQMRDCIKKGVEASETGKMAETDDVMATIKKADLGYCQLLHFKCAGDRTCDAWLFNGPVDNKDLT